MTTTPHHFILEAVDPDLLYSCLACRFALTDLSKLRRILEISDDDDISLDGHYCLTPKKTEALCSAFQVEFEHCGRHSIIYRQRPTCFDSIPYLLHEGFELPLLIQRRKPFAFIWFDSNSEASRAYKAHFDDYVSKGLLHSEDEIEQIDEITGRHAGRVFYTIKGEEWRIPAYKFIFQHLRPRDNGFEISERLEGSLLGYEQWQNNWWLEQIAQGDGNVTYGMAFRCALNREQLDSLIFNGFRSLPRFEGETFTVHGQWEEVAMKQTMNDDRSIEAIVLFNVGGRHLMEVVDLRKNGPFAVPTSIIPTINFHLSRPVRILLQRAHTK